MSYRTSYLERDLSGFANSNVLETGAMVLKSSKGPLTPIYCRSTEDVLLNFGNPSADYPDVFEALAFTTNTACWCVSAIGDDYAYGGVDVKSGSVVAFSQGRDYATFSYTSPSINTSDTLGTSAGLTKTYSGTLAHYPVLPASVKIKVDGVAIDASVSSGGVITGDDIDGSGTLVLNSGVYSFSFDGTAGAVASVTSTIDGSSNYDLSSGSVDKFVNVIVDGTTYANINLGQSAATTRASVISAINTAVGSTVATTSGTSYITVSGLIGSASGNVTVTSPTFGASGLALVFNPTALTATGTAPTGSCPTNGQVVSMSYTYTGAAITDVSHSFFAASPYADDLAVVITYVSGYKFNMELYRVVSTGYSLITEYDYSLIREKDNFGRSLYIMDVFNDNVYLIPTVNSAFSGTYSLTSTAKVSFAGGSRGGTPSSSDRSTAWAHFQKRNKYPVAILMDTTGECTATINSVINNYQPFAHGISVIPMGYTATTAVAYRNSLALDSDNVSLYTNWIRIQDSYNDSSSWISMVGSIGKKYAYMADTYDAASPAGIDENNHGGQLQDWTVLEVENDYSDAELQMLDEAQINPVVFDEYYGVMAYGDKTLQVSNSDTSFVGTRRLYNNMIKVITQQILRKEEFKLNDPLHRLLAKSATDSYIEPILAAGWLRDFYVQCDENNNDDNILNQRKFILDVYVKIMPNAQFTQLRLTRLSQTQTVAEFVVK